jgi:cobyrinic acid a,c-diamide synthase
MAALHRAPPMCGWLPEVAFSTQLPVRGASQRHNQTVLPMAFLTELAQLVEAHVDIDQLLALARSAPTVACEGELPQPCARRCRIAVTDDPCFSVGYQDNLALLQHFGAEPVSFSPLLDGRLPARIGGVYLTGAFLHEYGEELSRNESMRDALRQFAEAGGVVYSEGAGTAYLCRSFQLERGGTRHPGVGLIPLDAVCAADPARELEVSISEDSILGAVGTVVRGVDVGEWRLESPPEGVSSHLLLTLHVEHRDRASLQANPQLEGYSSFGQQCSTFHFLHFGSAPDVARSLVEAAAVARRA